MLPDTLGHLFDIPLRLAPSSVAVIQGDATLTYGDLDGWCNRAANALAGLGVRAGSCSPPSSVLGLQSWTSSQHFIGTVKSRG